MWVIWFIRGWLNALPSLYFWVCKGVNAGRWASMISTEPDMLKLRMCYWPFASDTLQASSCDQLPKVEAVPSLLVRHSLPLVICRYWSLLTYDSWNSVLNAHKRPLVKPPRLSNMFVYWLSFCGRSGSCLDFRVSPRHHVKRDENKTRPPGLGAPCQPPGHIHNPWDGHVIRWQG